ncbi:MAG: flippase [Patescibacteria group bacterium]|nr:flippase [Patescibacteria group bacterium]
MSLNKKIAANTLVQVVNKIAGTVLGILAIAVITRYLGPGGFGDYTIIITFVSIFAIIADFGLTLVASQMINKVNVDEEATVSNLFSFRLVSSLVIISLAPIVVTFSNYSQSIKTGIWLAALCFAFNNFNQIFVAIFQKYLRTDKIAIAEIVSRFILLVGFWLVAMFDGSLFGIILVMFLSNAVSFILHYFLSRKFVKVGFRFDLKVWQEIFQRAWPLLTTIVLNLIYLKADALFLSILRSREEVGLYGAAYKVVDVLVSLPFMFAGIILPLLVAAISINNKNEFKKIAQKFFNLIALACCPLLAGGIVLAEPIMRLVAGEKFSGTGPILAILSLAIGAVFMSCFFTHLMVAADKQKKLIIYYLITAITALPLYWLAINKYGIYGAAWTTVYSEVLILIGSIIAVKKELSFFPALNIFRKIILASLTMSSVLYLINYFIPLNGVWLVLAILFGGSLYFVLMILSGGLSINDLKSLVGRNQNGPMTNSL